MAVYKSAEFIQDTDDELEIEPSAAIRLPPQPSTPRHQAGHDDSGEENGTEKKLVQLADVEMDDPDPQSPSPEAVEVIPKAQVASSSNKCRRAMPPAGDGKFTFCNNPHVYDIKNYSTSSKDFISTQDCSEIRTRKTSYQAKKSSLNSHSFS